MLVFDGPLSLPTECIGSMEDARRTKTDKERNVLTNETKRRKYTSLYYYYYYYYTTTAVFLTENLLNPEVYIMNPVEQFIIDMFLCCHIYLTILVITSSLQEPQYLTPFRYKSASIQKDVSFSFLLIGIERQ